MKRIALIGMPNTGKSTFFNRLTGSSARVGNWPGITVDLLTAKILLGAEVVEVVDLPGVYSLHGYSEDEQVARHFIENNPVQLFVVIADATQLDRQLAIVLQLKDLNLPTVVLLNMADEAKRQGIAIAQNKLAETLGMPVVMLSAKFGNGFLQAKQAIETALHHTREVHIDPADFAYDDALEARLEDLVTRTVHVPTLLPNNLTSRLDRVLLHPWLGIPMFLGIMYLLFEAVYSAGEPLQNAVAWVLDRLKEGVVEPLVMSLPALLQSLLVEGIYDGIGTVLSFLPIITLFFLAMGVLEDSGYLSRAAFLMDAIMVRFGLDGRSFVMQLMGFGCNVPALMGTRVMRSRSLRLLTMLVIPFSLCSARLQVFVFLTAAVFAPRHAPLVLFSLYIMSFLAAFLTGFLYRKHLPNDEPLLLEMPPYRFPTVRQMLARGWQESRHFLRQASGYIMAGVVLVWALTHFPPDVPPASAATLAGQLAHWLEPVFSPLGIDNLMSIALLFGFIAKEVVIGSMAVIYGAGEEALGGMIAAQINWIQAYSFMLFILIYTPCLSTLAVLRQESKSWGFTLLVLIWSFTFAWVVSFLFYQLASLVFLR